MNQVSRKITLIIKKSPKQTILLSNNKKIRKLIKKMNSFIQNYQEVKINKFYKKNLKKILFLKLKNSKNKMINKR